MSIEYYMDKCSLWEVEDVLDCIPYTDRNMWEAHRVNSYITAQVNSTKRLHAKDIMKFAWDDEQVDSTTEISKEDINRLRKQAKAWLPE